MSPPRAASPAPIGFDVNAARLARYVLLCCFALELAFVLLDYGVNYGRWTEIGAMRRMLNITREDGLASWFAVTQTLLVSMTLWLILAATKHAHPSRWKVWGWLVLACFFTYMAIDDGAQLHERLGTAFESSGAALDFFPSYTWQLLFLPLFAALGLFTLAFLWFELERATSRMLLLLAMSFLALAVGLDFVEGLDSDHPWNVYTWLLEHVDIEPWSQDRFGRTDFETVRHFSKSIEETLEMAASSLLWFLFLGHLPAVAQELRIRFR